MIRYFKSSTVTWISGWVWDNGVVYTVLRGGNRVRWGEPDTGLFRMLDRGEIEEVYELGEL